MRIKTEYGHLPEKESEDIPGEILLADLIVAYKVKRWGQGDTIIINLKLAYTQWLGGSKY